MVERLTHREGNHTIRIGNEWRRHDPVWDKLAQYEDLGFTPEEIALLAKFYKEHTSVSAITANMKLVANSIKWEEYEKLKEQGRLIELPCDVGDIVWIIAPNYYKCNNRYNCEDYNPEEYLISWCQKNCSKGYQEIGTIQCVVYGIETYNDENSMQIDCLLDVNGNHYRYSIKDIFLTKEEAEAKLKERGE